MTLEQQNCCSTFLRKAWRESVKRLGEVTSTASPMCFRGINIYIYIYSSVCVCVYIYIYINGYQWYLNLAEILRGTEILSLLPMDQSSYRNTGVPTCITLHNVSEFQHPASSMSVYFQKTHCIFVVAFTLRCHQTWLPAKSPNSMEVYATIMELNDGLHIYASMDLDKTNKYQSVCKKTNF